ncbi:MAG TPA: thioesterase family protein [Pirellulales bacterium]|jgi:4-hydroxybenzoyl-CoA thioesterase/acyl-CoA thioester hydrolase|nr:thioesterase family protein [Pirellulales bacterium]
MPSFTATRRVEFRDTDAAGIMHFASFFPLMESVEHEFLRSLGLSVLAKDDSGPFSWPRVNAQCDFQSAVKFEDVLTITLTIARLGNKSVTYKFEVRQEERPVAEGRMTAVCCRLPALGHELQSIPIPEDVAARLRPYCA